jgi:3'-5' exoribonuclease
LPQDEVDMAQLVACAPEKPEVMRKDIEDTIDTFQSEGLKKIVREMLRLTGDKLEWFPAAQRLHHAERSGLLHHTTSMLNLARHVVAAYPFLNAELLYAGVILHDLCKTTEMISDETGSVSDYSADGLLIGHLVRGVARIEEAAKNVGVSGEIVLLLEHMVLSHHSIPEYGSPKAPMFPEAEVLARIDDLDAKMNEMQGILARVPEGAFSEKVWSLDRRIYHPKYQEIDGAE